MLEKYNNKKYKQTTSIDNEEQQNDETDSNNRKRQKLDNNNNSNNEINNGSKSEEIDITNLSKQTVAQLKEIASSLGILIKSSTRKNEIIEMIKAFQKRKQDLLVKQEIDSNINSFNKAITEFKIKDGIDPLEWSFWKVFRNKFIYRRIMSFMEKRFSPEYDSIISVFNMIERNQINILRDKVIRNQYLIFRCSYRDYRYGKEEEIISIFKLFRNNDDQDRLFYQQLFKYYSKFIIEFIAKRVNNEFFIGDGINDREELVNKMITTKCLPALQILIQQHKYKPTELNLKCSINVGALKFIQLILQYQPSLKESIKSVENILSGNESPIQVTSKTLYWLRNENIIDKTETNKNTIVDHIKSKEHQINETLSLKTLIIICKLLLLLQLSNSNTNNIISIEEIESFSNSLTIKELKLPLSDPSFQIHHRKDNILKLLDYYYYSITILDQNQISIIYISTIIALVILSRNIYMVVNQ